MASTDNTDGFFQYLLKLLSQTWHQVKKVWENVIQPCISRLYNQIEMFLKDLLKKVKSAFASSSEKIDEGYEYLKKLPNAILEKIKEIIQRMRDFFCPAKERTKEEFRKCKKWVSSKVEEVKDFFMSILAYLGVKCKWMTIKSIIAKFEKWKDMFDFIVEFFGLLETVTQEPSLVVSVTLNVFVFLLNNGLDKEKKTAYLKNLEGNRKNMAKFLFFLAEKIYSRLMKLG